ncbi:MAG: NAD-dependent epimerase/dehydratase family protein [Flavobacteriales bacterium]
MDLVTGGTGIVGSHALAELLARGRAVRALVRPGTDRSIVRRVLCHYHPDGDVRFQRIQWAEGDLFDMASLADAMRGVEHVYHAAAMVSFDPRDRAALFATNITGTANVVNAALESGVRRLCHVSSTASIGRRDDGALTTESTPYRQTQDTSPYTISKHDAELEVQRGIAEGLDAVLVNPCVVLGPGLAGRSSMTMIERLRKGSRFFPPGANAVVDARDVATAMVRLMESGPSGERHLLIGENVSYERLFGLMAKAAGHAPPAFRLRPWMLGLAWRMEAFRTLFGGRPMITRYTAATSLRPTRYDGSKAERVLGMRFRDAEEAVANTMAFVDAQ